MKKKMPVGKYENANPLEGQRIWWRGSNGVLYCATVLRIIGLGNYSVCNVDGSVCEVYDERIETVERDE